MSDTKLTPTEELIMEVLAARYRLGEHLWTMSTTHAKSLKSLSEKGYLRYDSGIVEKTFKVFLSEKGKEEYLSETYQSPLETKLRWLVRNARFLDPNSDPYRVQPKEPFVRAKDVLDLLDQS